MRCHFCLSEKHTIKVGKVKGRRRYKCKSCNKTFIHRQEKKKKCKCGMPLINGECVWCKEPLIQYHWVDRSVGLHI